jgi:hypothetical protein
MGGEGGAQKEEEQCNNACLTCSRVRVNAANAAAANGGKIESLGYLNANPLELFDVPLTLSPLNDDLQRDDPH